MPRSSKKNHLTKVKAKASAVRPSNNCEKHSVAIAVLEQSAKQTTDRFDDLGDRFDRILGSVEKLAIDVTSLTSRHDTQIQTLQKQTVNVENTINELRTAINEIPDRIARQVSEANTKLTDDLTTKSEDTKSQVKLLDERVRILEKWRLILVGVGMAAAALIEFLYRVFLR